MREVQKCKKIRERKKFRLLEQWMLIFKLYSVDGLKKREQKGRGIRRTQKSACNFRTGANIY